MTRPSIRALSACLCASLLAGCAGLASQTPQRFHVLDVGPSMLTPAAAAAPAAVPAAQRPTLLLVPTTAARFFDTQDIVFCKTDTQCGYYQHNSWTEPPNRRLDALLVERLTRSGEFASVAVAGNGVRGDLLIAVQLDAIYHDATTNPGRSNVALVAALIDVQRRAMLAQARFEGSAPAVSYDAAGAVRGFDKTLAVLLDQVAEWAGAATEGTLDQPGLEQSVHWTTTARSTK